MVKPTARTLLTGGQPQAQGDMGFARAARPEGDDVFPPLDPFAAGQFQHLHLVEAGDRLEVEAVQTFDRGKLGGLDPALDHPPFAIDQLQLHQFEGGSKRCRVGLDYHVEIAKHYYSVPHQLIRQEVEARITIATVEIFHRGKRVASHQRSARPHRPTTVADHMPSSHRRYRDWTHERIRREAALIGSDTAVLVDVIMRSRPHPEQGFRSCIGIIGLVKRFGVERVDAACARALVLGTRSYSSVAAILKNHRVHALTTTAEAPILIHENIRGPAYFR